MPITINGTGTITGVSVGGLPDGIVDTDMLAANAVSSAKLASGAGGKILQSTSAVFTGLQNIGNSWTTITNFDLSLTSTVANSKFLILGRICHSVGGSGSDAFRLRRTAGGASAVTIGSSNQSTGSLGLCTVGGHRSGGPGYEYGADQAVVDYMDQPNAAAGTVMNYKIQGLNFYNTNVNLYINRAFRDGYYNDTAVYMLRAASAMTLLEIAP